MNVICFSPEADRFKEFLEFPKLLFPLRSLKEDYPQSLIETCFAVVSDDKMLGRIAVYKDNGLRYHDLPARAAGSFHCINNVAVAKLLLDAAANYAKDSGAKYLVGPLNGNTWHHYRFIEKTDPSLFFTETWNPEYYPELWRKNGFEQCALYHSNIDHHPGASSDEAETDILRFKNIGIRFRNINTLDFENECRSIHSLSEKAFSGNAFFTPEEFPAFYAKYQNVLPFIDPELVIIAENQDKEMVGFSFGIADVLNPDLKRMVLKTVARVPGDALSGLGNILIYLLRKKAAEKGYKSVIHAFFNNSGATAKLTRDYSGKLMRTYTLFARKC